MKNELRGGKSSTEVTTTKLNIYRTWSLFNANSALEWP